MPAIVKRRVLQKFGKWVHRSTFNDRYEISESRTDPDTNESQNADAESTNQSYTTEQDAIDVPDNVDDPMDLDQFVDDAFDVDEFAEFSDQDLDSPGSGGSGDDQLSRTKTATSNKSESSGMQLAYNLRYCSLATCLEGPVINQLSMGVQTTVII